MSAGVKNSMQQKAQQPQWNVQVVRGKVTTRCLWNACKALSIGLLLLTIGTTMAVIGYYADQLSIRSETRGNSTVRIKNESRGFHLNNLSYAGPIVMGIGGFIVVAACVMTFEARDSAAKVVPARFKPSMNSSVQGGSSKSTPRTSRTFQRMESKRNTSCQTGGSRGQGSYKLEPSSGAQEWSPKNDPASRKAFTAAFVQFSRELLESSSNEANRRWRGKINEMTLNKSPSAPDLASEESSSRSLGPETVGNATRKLPSKVSPQTGNRLQRDPVRRPDAVSSNLLLRPNYLQRQALSMDNPFYENYECYTPPSMRLSRQHSGRSDGSRESFEMELGSSAGVSGSQVSMALDLHDCQVTLKVKDESANKRSDTARRHQLLRQKPVEDDRDERFPRCSCIPRFLYTPNMEESNIRTKSSTNLKSPCHHCLRATGSTGARGHTPKMTADFRSQSFSQTCSYPEPKKCTYHEDHTKIFCIEDHKKRTNLSSENIVVCCEDKLRCIRRHSPCVSPHRSSRSVHHECRVQRLEGSECLVHRSKDPPGSLVRSNAKRRKSNQKIEGSLSTEEKSSRPTRTAIRSASCSPTRKLSTSASSSLNNSCRESPSSQRSPSPVTVQEFQIESKTEVVIEQTEDEPKEEMVKDEKVEVEEPS